MQITTIEIFNQHAPLIITACELMR